MSSSITALPFGCLEEEDFAIFCRRIKASVCQGRAGAAAEDDWQELVLQLAAISRSKSSAGDAWVARFTYRNKPNNPCHFWRRYVHSIFQNCSTDALWRPSNKQSNEPIDPFPLLLLPFPFPISRICRHFSPCQSGSNRHFCWIFHYAFLLLLRLLFQHHPLLLLLLFKQAMAILRHDHLHPDLSAAAAAAPSFWIWRAFPRHEFLLLLRRCCKERHKRTAEIKKHCG